MRVAAAAAAAAVDDAIRMSLCRPIWLSGRLCSQSLIELMLFLCVALQSPFLLSVAICCPVGPYRVYGSH